MSNRWLDPPESGPGDLNEDDREKLNKYLGSPSDFPPEFKLWLADWIQQVVVPAIFALQIQGRTKGSAPLSAAYVTIDHLSALTGERALTAGKGISITDGGADGPVTINATTPTYPPVSPADFEESYDWPNPGASGSSGSPGSPGATGATGPAGLGIPGVDGEDGRDGWPGSPGPQGLAGSPGSAGATGPAGLGIPGVDGEDGLDGWPGIQGAAGAAGLTGATGRPGLPGDDGDDGWPGPPGVPGAAGAAGTAGVAGAAGSAGPPGRDGDDGEDPFPIGARGNTQTVTQMPGYPGGTSTFLRADGTFGAPTASVALFEANIVFDGTDSMQRVTITDAGVSATSKIVFSVRRTTITDANDPGWIYVANIVTLAAGSFDVLIAALDWDAAPNTFPDETVILTYTIA